MEKITIDIREWLRDYTAIRGANISANQLASRRGVTTFSVTVDDDHLLVKLAEATDDDTPANLSGVLREAGALSAIDELQQRFRPVLLTRDNTVALAENWIDGTPAFKDVQTLAEAADQAGLIDLLWHTLTELALLHARGWAHGDLQPMHFLAVEGGAVLLDYGVAQSPELPMEDYQGGMVHFNAPEVAAQIVAHGTATATPTSDIFSLGAVFAFAITGEVIGRYDKTDSWQQKLEVLADGGLRLNQLRQALSAAPVVLHVLERLLDVDPDSRPRDAAAVMALLPVVG
jgi:serine/threonine protein kinase